MMTLIRASMEVARCPSGLHLVTFDANMLSHPAFHGIAHDTLLISTCIPPKDWYFDDGIEGTCEDIALGCTEKLVEFLQNQQSD